MLQAVSLMAVILSFYKGNSTWRAPIHNKVAHLRISQCAEKRLISGKRKTVFELYPHYFQQIHPTAREQILILWFDVRGNYDLTSRTAHPIHLLHRLLRLGEQMQHIACNDLVKRACCVRELCNICLFKMQIGSLTALFLRLEQHCRGKVRCHNCLA